MHSLGLLRAEGEKHVRGISVMDWRITKTITSTRVDIGVETVSSIVNNARLEEKGKLNIILLWAVSVSLRRGSPGLSVFSFAIRLQNQVTLLLRQRSLRYLLPS